MKPDCEIDKIMKDLGFKMVLFPTNADYTYWFVKKKIPYSSQISRRTLLDIIGKLKEVRD